MYGEFPPTKKTASEWSNTVSAEAGRARTAAENLKRVTEGSSSDLDKTMAKVDAYKAYTDLQKTIHQARVATSPGNNESKETGSPVQNAITWHVADTAHETWKAVGEVIVETGAHKNLEEGGGRMH